MRSDAMVSRRAVLAAAVLVTAGCAGSASSGSSAELVWATGGTTPSDQGPAVDIVTRWNKLHPDVPKVRVQVLPQSADEQHQVLALELNAGLRNFDIFDLDEIWTPEFAQRGWLVDL